MHDMTHLYVWHDSFICVTWDIHMCAMTHRGHEDDGSLIYNCLTWLIYLRNPQLIYVCDMTHLYAQNNDSQMSHVTHMCYMCDMTHLYVQLMMCANSSVSHCAHTYVWHDSSICAEQLIHTWDMTRHDTHMYISYSTYVISHICISHSSLQWLSSHLYVSHDSWWEVGDWGRDPKKCTGRDWGMGSSTI